MGANGGRIGVFIGFNFDVIYCIYIEMCVCVCDGYPPAIYRFAMGNGLFSSMIYQRW